MIKIYIGSVEYRISILFPAVLVVLLTLNNTSVPVWCVAASAMHEAGHFAAMYACGCRPSAVSIGVFGVSVKQRPEYFGNRVGALTALAGPAVNIVSFAVLLPLCGWSVPTLVHLVMGVFNLLPIEALDGGRALYYSIAEIKGDRKAEYICFVTSLLTLIPLATVGFFLLLRSGYNFTLLAVSVYLGLIFVLKRRH